MNIFSDEPEKISKVVSLGIKKFTNSLKKLKPELLLVLGDRYEIFSLTIAAYILGIPIAHLHGGETTQGAIDEGFRHSITKMSDIHFVANEIYKKKVKQLGENEKIYF